MALSHAGCPWPLLLPVHDAVRDGYRGVAVVQPAAGAGEAAQVAGRTVKFETDSLHSSRLPEGILRLDQLLRLFGKQLAAAGAPAAAAACRAAVAAELELAPASMADAAAARGGGATQQQAGAPGVAVAVRHCYALPSPGEEQGECDGCCFAACDSSCCVAVVEADWVCAPAPVQPPHAQQHKPMLPA